MITQEKMEVGKAIVAFIEEYRKQNSFIKLTCFQYRVIWDEIIPSIQYKEVLLKISDISCIKGTDKDEMEIFLNNGEKFYIKKKNIKKN